MRIAIISDIHGNLPALESVLKSIREEGCDSVYCLGDIVGYGARPEECVACLRDRGIPCLLGNHDAAACGVGDASDFNPFAREAVMWTAQHLSPSAKAFLMGLPYSLSVHRAKLVHSSPLNPDQWTYIFSAEAAAAQFPHFTEDVCFFGHTHYPVVFTEPGTGRRLINVGSVGQPRDRDPRACWGCFETDSRQFRWVRVSYPIEDAAAQILQAGLPVLLADRLFVGQ